MATNWALLLLSVTVLGYFLRFRSTRSRRPPLVPYTIPWLGSALDLNKDPDKFFREASARYGSVFRVKALGQEITYVTAPSLIQGIYRDNKHYEFMPLRLEIMEKVFATAHEVTHAPAMIDTYFPAQHRALAPSNVPELLSAYAERAFELFSKAIDGADGTSMSLIQFIIPPTYCAAAAALLGKDFPAMETYAPFRKFDDAFPLMLAGLPRFMLPGPHKAWWEVIRLIEQYLETAKQKEDAELPAFVRSTLSMADGSGWSTETAATVLASYLWAAEANAIWAGYWLIVFMLQEPGGLAPLVEELDRARAAWLAAHPGTPLTPDAFHTFIADSAGALPLLGSAIQETLRVTSDVMALRRVIEPVEMEGYELGVGERVVSVTRLVHLDEEIHPGAEAFRPTRYLENQKFTKNGKAVPNHSMPFGGGVSMCEGRHFVMGELKILIALLLTYATIGIDPKKPEIPKMSRNRIGAGIMPPIGDLNVIIKRRQI
ncbi:hypothetical protein CERSUDRAFT_109437 [Gelatoporia subvermispora B]|uniref:Cytochrome P450 n=1 Tax=Ceriporiopsis subvermispora (strain B) TaxID=914234 RepID=M2Q3T2_CERS8|nr:hypothetical protein CERSUDRAFT_109437 [Gelatoporia subvermispora B]